MFSIRPDSNHLNTHKPNLSNYTDEQLRVYNKIYQIISMGDKIDKNNWLDDIVNIFGSYPQKLWEIRVKDGRNLIEWLLYQYRRKDEPILSKWHYIEILESLIKDKLLSREDINLKNYNSSYRTAPKVLKDILDKLPDRSSLLEPEKAAESAITLQELQDTFNQLPDSNTLPGLEIALESENINESDKIAIDDGTGGEVIKTIWGNRQENNILSAPFEHTIKYENHSAGSYDQEEMEIENDYEPELTQSLDEQEIPVDNTIEIKCGVTGFNSDDDEAMEESEGVIKEIIRWSDSVSAPTLFPITTLISSKGNQQMPILTPEQGVLGTANLEIDSNHSTTSSTSHPSNGTSDVEGQHTNNPRKVEELSAQKAKILNFINFIINYDFIKEAESTKRLQNIGKVLEENSDLVTDITSKLENLETKFSQLHAQYNVPENILTPKDIDYALEALGVGHEV